MKKPLTKPIIVMSTCTFWSIMLSWVFAATLFASNPTEAQSMSEVSITVEFNDASLTEAFDEIENKTEFTFLYNKLAVASSSQKITLKREKTSVADILQDIMVQTGLRFMQTNHTIAVKLPNRYKQKKLQTGSITGTVTNEQGEPIPTANVLLVEVSRGAATNVDGEYTISDVEAGTYSLRVSFIGYKTYSDQVTITAGETLTKNVILKRGTETLEKLIVTGYGRQSKVEFTGSASQVNIEERLEHVPVVNVSSALQGAASGLQVAASSGTPGAKQNINIRGISSINAGGNPLIVVDGIPVGSGNFGSSGDAIDNNSDAISRIGLMATLNPQSIKSITVLKGPVATAQYGARGSNGVIVITTKRGTRGETKYGFSMQYGTVSGAVEGPQSLNAFQAAELYKEGMRNANLPVPDDLPFWDGETSTDWGELATRDHATTQSYVLSASGGSKKATFYGAINFQKKENIVITSEFSRVGANLNFSYDFSEDISITNQFSGSYSNQEGYRESDTYWGNPLATTYNVPSFFPAYDDDGTFNFDLPQYNALFTVRHDKSKIRLSRIINSTQLNIDILDNLSFHSEVGIDYIVNEQELYQGPVHGGGADVNGAASGVYTRQFIGTIQNSLKYIWAINENNTLNAQLIQSAELYDKYLLSAQATGFATRGLYNLSSASVPRNGYSINVDGSRVSFLGKVHYGFKNKIFVDATLRQEASSKFANDYRWGTFYGVGAAWLISSEDFLSEARWLDLLKVRASFGITGNSSIGRNLFQAFLGYASSYDGQAGATPAQRGNTRLTWEKARKINIGLNFGLFNKIDGDITLFHSTTYDLLYAVPLSRTSGFNSQIQNLGELVNEGIELSLNVDVIRTEDFRLNVNGNFTYVRNEITELPTDASGNQLTIINAGLRYKAVEGYPVNAWYMRTWAGVNKHNGMPLWYLNRKPTQQEKSSGKAFKLERFGDQWLTSTYSMAESEYQGASPMPTHYGSVGFTLQYKGFTVGASLYGSFGAKIYDNNSDNYITDGATNLSLTGGLVSQLDRWQKPGDITEVPKRIYGNTTRSSDISSRFLYDADYLRLQTVRVGYNLPASILDQLNLGVRKLNIFVVGRNLWTYRFDPDLQWGPVTGDLGYVDFTYPMLKSITFGLNIQF